MKKNNIICFVAHPDDEALGPGGTLIKHAESGDNVFIVIFSDGEGAKKKQKRNTERLKAAEKWCKLSKCKLLNIHDFPDQRLDTVPQIEIVSLIENSISTINPDIVYTHSPMDINKDHEIVANAVLVALRPMRFKKNKNFEIRAFETPSSTDQSPNLNKFIFLPNLYISIDGTWIKKVKGLKCYKNELGNYPHPRSIKNIEALAIKRGAEAGLKKAEAFMILKKVLN